MSDIEKSIRENNYLKIKQCVKNGDNLNIEIEDEGSLLCYALRQKCSFDIIELLVENGASLSYLSDNGVGILDEAIILADMEILKYLIEDKRLDITKTTRKSGFTPLIQAACYGYIDVVKYLLKMGADINEKDNFGMDALSYSKKLQQKNMKEFLEKELAKSNT
jgi:ankyrin repeat protein